MRDASAPERATDARDRVLAREDPRYPGGLRALRDPPAHLYVRGALPGETVIAVAIVGSRAATPYGVAVARRLAADLARLGVWIVSGLARGIDAAAHEAALDAGGDTIAVLPSGLDTITPPAHAPLAARIAARGALVTEIATGGPRFRGQFIERNRLIAALAAATVVVEAAEASGALSTASAARRLGRTVLAVPGDIDRPTARGCHALLRSEAMLCEHAHDVLKAIAVAATPDARVPSRAPATAKSRTTRRRRTATPVLPALDPATDEARLAVTLGREAETLDALAARSGLSIDRALAALTRLEWSGLARVLPGQRWVAGRS